MPALATIGTVASDSPEFTGPMMKSTLSTNASCLARFTALVGSPLVSRVTSSSLRPLTPPAALISSTANCTPWFSAMAAEDSGPVSDDSQPMRMAGLRGRGGGGECKGQHEQPRDARGSQLQHGISPPDLFRPRRFLEKSSLPGSDFVKKWF